MPAIVHDIVSQVSKGLYLARCGEYTDQSGSIFKQPWIMKKCPRCLRAKQKSRW